ncbi:hypothetical protein JL720_7301 [Aureococcus anophagefferens]|nr:hypothetical protein JL720_7301 [Aureococcus anophagefferens]
MGKKKGQTERTRVSAHEDRLKLNGVAWAAKLGIPTDEEFWAKWATLDDATVMVEPPVKDGSRCAYGCKRKVYFLESNARTHSQNCDGVCDRRAQKIIANFGFSREHNTGTTDGVLKRARRGAAGGGKRGAGGSKTGIDDARSAPESRGFGARDKPTHCPKAAPEKLPYFRRCRREDAEAGFVCEKPRRLESGYCSERCRRLAEGGGDGDAPAPPARAPVGSGSGRGRAPPAAPVGSATWAAAPRPVAPRPPPPPAAPRMRPEGAIRPSSATATASSTPTTRRSAATSSSSGPRSGTERRPQSGGRRARRLRSGRVEGEDRGPEPHESRAAAAPRPPLPPGPTPRDLAAREQAELERVLALSMQGLAVHPELADSRGRRARARSREQAAPPVSPVREDDDDDLAWALELSRASEPGSFDAGGADPWERVVDAQSGAPYWWNRDTDETTWDDPAAGRDGGGLSAALDGSAAAPFDTLEGMLRAVGLSDLAPALAAEEVDLETLKFLCLDDLVSDLGIPEAQAAALLAARDARERGQAGLA